jgi:TonB family protein
VSDPIQLEEVPAAAVQPKPAPKPQQQGYSKAEIAAAVDRAAEAEQQMDEAAGSLQSTLLAAPSGETAPELEVSTPPDSIELDTDQLLAAAVRPPARRGDLVDIGDVDTLPRPLEFEQPAYDELAQRMRQEGTIIVEVLIDETGRVADARILQEIPRSRLNDSAIRAARRWSYEPALKNGVAVKVWKSERIIFKL